MDYLATLNTLASKFAIAPPGGSAAMPQLQIDPPLDLRQQRGMALSETVQRMTKVDVPTKLDLAFVGKWVRSVTSDAVDPTVEDPIGGMPIVPQIVTGVGLLTTLPPASLMQSDAGQAATAGVPEVLGRVKGTITQVVEKLQDVIERRPITLAVRWRVFDESTPGVSTPAAGVLYKTDPNPAVAMTALPDPLDLPAGGAPGNPPLTLFLGFPVVFSELTSATPPVGTFKVQASVKLSVATGINEVQSLSTGGVVTGGTFQLAFADPMSGALQTTAAIQWNASAAAIQAALENLAAIGVGNVTCSGGPLPNYPVTITFQGNLAGQNVAQLSGTSSLTGTAPTLNVMTVVDGSPGLGTVTTDWIDLPPVPLIVPTIPIPTIVVLCEFWDFAGRKLVLVPSNSLVGATGVPGSIGIGPALALTRSALTTLAPGHPFLGFLAGGTGTAADLAAGVLLSLSPAAAQTIIAAHSRVDDLSANEFEFDPGWFNFFGIRIGRVTANDFASSVICIGLTGKVFDFFNDFNLSEYITRFQITLDGSLGCAVRNLDWLNPLEVRGNYSGPPGAPPIYGNTITSFSPRNSHEDAISSLSF